MSARTVVGLGSNVGDRSQNLREAIARIERVTPIIARSRVYETKPVGGPKQDDFLNAAVLLEPKQTPIELLDALQAIELDLGRVREERWGPRTIDLDILWMDDRVIDDPRLIVPHPRLAERAFALAPLLDLVPDAVDPKTKKRYVVPEAELRIIPDGSTSE